MKTAITVAVLSTILFAAVADASGQPTAGPGSGSPSVVKKKTEKEPADLYSKDLSKPPQTKKALVHNTSVGFKPLTELGTATYKGQKGGLYDNGANVMPTAHRMLLEQKTAEIKPLDREGRPSEDGKVVLLIIGMSNTSQEAKGFIRLAAERSKVFRRVVIVDGAQGAQGSMQWSTTTHASMGADPWEVVEKRLAQQSVTTSQVQAVWLKTALMGVAQFGEFPKHAEVLEESICSTIQIANRRYPNLKVAYLSSRIYGGYAPGGNREPFAYESAFAVRSVVLKQIAGSKELNCDPARGSLNAPVIVWGPYLWADGMTPRRSDGLTWRPNDLRSDDGMHPSEDGQEKVGRLLLDFFTSDPTASWFIQP